MSKVLFSLLINFLTVSAMASEGDGPTYLQKLSYNSMLCDGVKVKGDFVLKELGQVFINVYDKDTTSPWVEVSSEVDDLHFKIGNSYLGKLTQRDHCRYYSTEKSQFYVCDLIDASKPLTFQDVQRANRHSSISEDIICPVSAKLYCIRLLNCQVK